MSKAEEQAREKWIREEMLRARLMRFQSEAALNAMCRKHPAGPVKIDHRPLSYWKAK